MVSIPTFTPGTSPSQTDLAFGIQRPVVKAYQGGTGQVYTSGAAAAALIWTVGPTQGPDTMWTSGTNPTRFTVLTPGYVTGLGQVACPSNSTGYRELIWYKNGISEVAEAYMQPSSSGQTVFQCGFDDQANANDYYELLFAHSTGGPLTIVTGLNKTWASLLWERT